MVLKNQKTEAAGNLGGILRVCRDLMAPIRGVVLAGSGLSWDKAELLLELWRVAKGIGDWQPDAEGFVTFKELRESLVNSQPHVSRRIKEVKAKEKAWVEVQEGKKGEAHHANSHRVRISKKGIAIIKPVWEHLHELASNLFEGIRLTDRRVHFQVNQSILQKMRPYRYDACAWRIRN
jgi:DNA-binding MarR family transcriptional regulator